MSEKLRNVEDSLRNTWNHLASVLSRGRQIMRFLYIAILMLFEERYFQFFPLKLFCRGHGDSCCILSSSRAWFILQSEGQIWNLIIILKVFIGWKIIHRLIFKVNYIARFNYRNNLAKDVVISVLWFSLSPFSVNTCLGLLV